MDRNRGLLADFLDEGDGTGHVPGGRLVRLGVDDRTEDIGTGLLDNLELLVWEHAGEPLAVVLDFAVHAEDKLAGHANLDAQAGRLLELLHGLQRRHEVGVARRGRGVEVDAVRADLVEPLAHVDHVFHAQLGRLHLLFTGLVDLHHAEQIGGIRVRPVRCVVEAHVRHGAVEDGEDGRREQSFDRHLVERDHGLRRLERVIDPAEFHGVERQDALEDLHRRLAADGQMRAAGELRRDQRAGRLVFGQRHLVPGLNANDAPRRREDLDELVYLIVLQGRDLPLVGGVFRCCDDVGTQLVGRQLDRRAVPHSSPYFAHCVTPPFP